MNLPPVRFLGLGLLIAAANVFAQTNTPRLPNIVFLLADDLGREDLRCYGHPYSRTPNIDSIARDGTRFMQFYATGSTCCPARTGLMSSKFPATYATYPDVGGFSGRPTVTDFLKKAGYVTGHFGKWHIGPDEKPGTYGIDIVGSGMESKDAIRDPRGRDAQIYDQAIKFIEEHKDGAPFYVNVWGHVPHFPVRPVEPLVNRWLELKVNPALFPAPMQAKFSDAVKAGGNIDDGMRRYLADIESLDDSVGRVLKKIDELGLRDNTIVIFSTDQGADMSKLELGGLRLNMMGSNGALRGGKHSHWEGGVCVPWIVRWPGKIPAGRTDTESVLSGVDYLPTLCSIAGVKINSDEFDGEDASAAWFGESVHVRTKPLFWRASAAASDSFIRDGKWKLHKYARTSEGKPELFDITTDPNESQNVAADHPEVVKELAAKLDAWIATLPKTYVKGDDKQE